MDLEHGGNVRAAAEQFNLPLEHWVDLSTGISPWSWPVPAIPTSVWRTLPEADQQLELAAAQYYGCAPEAVLAVPGSQFSLQFTPALLTRGKVAMPQRGYAEHRLAWIKAGHQIIDYVDIAELEKLVAGAAVDHALVINPNNPTGELVPHQQLVDLGQRLNQSEGYLVVDEAFADPCPEISLATLCPQQGLIVYRSVGKFFGLAGLRLGFMLAQPSLCRKLASNMPPWLLSHPARWIGLAALSDRRWQIEQRRRLEDTAVQWLPKLQALIPQLQFSGTALFTSGFGDPDFCRGLYQAMGRRALLIRLIEECNGQGMVRFGLPLPADREKVERLIIESVEECKCGIV
jgi:cobalamin biosynthetic protein CobC